MQIRNELNGAKVYADDGKYLGKIAPSYVSESIFCSYGTYGASYKRESIWCTYGEYGASYKRLSPFCTYSTTPPLIYLDGIAVASLTVNTFAYPIPISPYELKGLFE
jgi:hypothetical protein